MRHNYDVENAILYAVFIIGAVAIVAVMYFFYFRDRIKERKKTAKKLSVKLKEKETREFLIAYWWVFFVIIVFLIFMALYLLGAFNGVTSSRDGNHCTTVTDRNGEEHDMECDHDYDWVDYKLHEYDAYDHDY